MFLCLFGQMKSFLFEALRPLSQNSTFIPPLHSLRRNLYTHSPLEGDGARLGAAWMGAKAG